MQKKVKKNKKKSGILLLILVIIVLAVIVLSIAYNINLQNGTKKNEASTEMDETAAIEAENSEINFPYVSEDGNLQVTSLIQFTGPNMDAENVEGEDIAGIQVENLSEQYLKEAEITVRMENGIEYEFLIEDLPAGEETVAFDMANQAYDGQTKCQEIECTTQTSDASMAEDMLSITADGSVLTITNITEQEIENAVVIYRCMTGDSYIGGNSYEIMVSGLEAGENFEYEDTACIFGTPEAVSVEID